MADNSAYNRVLSLVANVNKKVVLEMRNVSQIFFQGYGLYIVIMRYIYKYYQDTNVYRQIDNSLQQWDTILRENAGVYGLTQDKIKQSSSPKLTDYLIQGVPLKYAFGRNIRLTQNRGYNK